MNDLFLIQWGINIIGLIHTCILDTKISEDMNQLQKTLRAKDLNKPARAGINISELNKYGMEPNLNLLQ